MPVDEAKEHCRFKKSFSGFSIFSIPVNGKRVPGVYLFLIFKVQVPHVGPGGMRLWALNFFCLIFRLAFPGKMAKPGFTRSVLRHFVDIDCPFSGRYLEMANLYLSGQGVAGLTHYFWNR
ncbi:hypothetical protein ACSAZK_13335 [Methanosarcina sp. Mfa9]|uniref:hypothetical protein n=1 Tax=Methanosarcina sp. Mfa9 TaxID=3439063 RepID=UPI003F85753E